MKMKRFIAIVMALFLVLAGCSNSNDNQDKKKMQQTMGKTRNSSCSGSKFNRCYKKLASEFKKNIKMLILNLTMVDQEH